VIAWFRVKERIVTFASKALSRDCPEMC